MLQIIQYQKSGKLSVAEVPPPALKEGGILVQNIYSLISAGTERTSVETAQASLVGKARSRPDLVKQVLDNASKEGWVATVQKVRNRLDNYKELGYTSAGIVVDSAVDSFRAGDAVACAGYAYHAEIVSIPKNLAVKIPKGVSYEEGAFATLGAIALQGVRRADVRIGESIVVVGLGLLGLITIQLLKASGCRVLGLDIDKGNFRLARKLGCDHVIVSNEDALRSVETFTRGHGSDAVILTAATKSNQPLELALRFARKRSPIVIVGSVGMNVVRAPFYEKELDLRIATSYGPGRYDPAYEEKGNDYPIGYVRWTENRNMEAFLDLVAAEKVNVKALATQRFHISDALQAYDIITGKVKQKHIGVLIEYKKESGKGYGKAVKVDHLQRPDSPVEPTRITIGFIGAGNFAQSYLLPPLKHLDVPLRGVATTTPVHAQSVAKKFGFEYFTSSAEEILHDAALNAVFIASRHDSHASYAIEALRNGKHVFIEKPLAINKQQLEAVREAYVAQKPGDFRHLMVGFNRRYSAPFKDIKQFFEGRNEPFAILYRVHAGFMPLTRWMQDREQGGRFIGEACHFIDCMAFLTDARPVRIYAERVSAGNQPVETSDTVITTVTFSDGSIGSLLYLANGDSAVGKEYCEVYSGGRTAILDDFSMVKFFSGGKEKTRRYDRTKGHRQEVEHFVNVIRGNEDPMLSFTSIYETSEATLNVMESLLQGKPMLLVEGIH